MFVLDWVAGDRKQDAKVLDFACGYGRSTRFLVKEIPPANIWASDIYPSAVEFQKTRFQVNGFVSDYEPETVKCDERFDLIFVASLFTHLPRARFEQWLGRLFSLLKPTGAFAFSVHDSCLAKGRVLPSDGYLFVPESESSSLDLNEYGSTYVSEAAAAEIIRSVIGVNYGYKRLPQALCGSHDIYLVSRDPAETFASLKLVNPPAGYVDRFSLSDDGQLRIGGWAAEPDPDGSIADIVISVDGKTVGQLMPFFNREDVARALGRANALHSGWDFSKEGFDRMRDGDEVIEVLVHSSTGKISILHCSQLRDASQPHLPPPPGPRANGILGRIRSLFK
jgi:SAM-dependent methyltransferase